MPSFKFFESLFWSEQKIDRSMPKTPCYLNGKLRSLFEIEIRDLEHGEYFFFFYFEPYEPLSV